MPFINKYKLKSNSFWQDGYVNVNHIVSINYLEEIYKETDDDEEEEILDSKYQVTLSNNETCYIDVDEVDKLLKIRE